MVQIQVAVLSASGEAGRSIVSALLEQPALFNVHVLVRNEATETPVYQTFQRNRVTLIPYSSSNLENDLADRLKGIDVVIPTIIAQAYDEQIPLIAAAKKAGVKRFVPSAFSTVQPPEGVTDLREQRGHTLHTAMKHYVPYTYIELGWWHTSLVPKLPSGRSDYLESRFPVEPNIIPGGGNTPTAMTDVLDVGRYVARIIADPRTLNKLVFAYGEVLTLNQIYDVWDEITKEKIERKYEVESTISRGKKRVEAGNTDLQALTDLHIGQYWRSWGLRGDNTPENAKFLGYLDAKELYPDVQSVPYVQFVEKAVDGAVRTPFSE